MSDRHPDHDNKPTAPPDRVTQTPVPDLPPELPAQRVDEPSRTTSSDGSGEDPSRQHRVPDLPPKAAEAPALRGAMDSTGYRTTERELDFVGVSREEYGRLQRIDSPLGMDSEQYREMKQELSSALEREGLHDADVRIQGTSAHFYSRNPTKEFYPDAQAVSAAADHWRSRGIEIPTPVERDAVNRYQDAGYEHDPRPRDALFDQDYSLFGDESLRSDYDIQISSNRLDQEMHAYQAEHPGDPCISEKGGHWRDEAIRERFPELAAWKKRWQERTGREANLAGFAGSGPRGPSAFRADDWMMIRRRRVDEE